MESGTNLAVLMLGGNIGDTPVIFERSRKLINDQVGEITGKSSLFESEPWGFTDQTRFLNQALTIKTSLSPDLLLEITTAIEKQLGKNAKFLNGPRVIDIDIMFFNQVILESPLLTIPHPRLHLRRFNLAPLAQIIPDFVHPVLKQDLKTLLLNCNDPLKVNVHF